MHWADVWVLGMIQADGFESESYMGYDDRYEPEWLRDLIERGDWCS